MNAVSPPSAGADAAALAPCARCAQLQRTCCQTAEILVTEPDVARIAAHVGRTDFYERRRPSDPAYFDADEDDPNWLALTLRPDGTRRLLKRQPSGDCTFLGRAGCDLPLEVRPLVCRLYPYAYNETGLAGSDESYCPTSVLSPEGRPMAEVLDIDALDAERWRVSLYQELARGTP